jgi:TolB protein
VSPDGQRLIVSSDRSGNPDLWTLPASGGDMQPFAVDPTPEWAPAWSPDETRVAFYAYRSGNREIWVQPTAGGVARQLTSGDAESVNPAWSPDGRFIAFSSRQGGSSDLYIMTADGSNVRRLTSDPDIDDLPSWSPDGKWIAFVSYRRGIERDLWRVPAAGGERQLILHQAGFPLRWSRDGKSLYFIGFGNPGIVGAPNIWAASADGEIKRQITDLTGRRGNPSPNVLMIDERYLYFGWNEQMGDIWVMDIIERP